MVIKRLLSLAILLSGIILHAEDYKIIQMVGPYDLDGDNQLEFLTIESIPPEIHLGTVLRHYELDAEGYQELIWELNAPDGLLGHFVNVTLGDLDGDGNPELITVMNVSGTAGESLLRPVMFVYPWNGLRFAEEQIGRASGRERV